MSGSRTIIAGEDRLDNVHPGDILREDFLIGTEISTADVSVGTGLSIDRINELLEARGAINADTDIRLARYLGMSEGFFLGLQNDYDLEEAWLARADELNRVTKRAA
ncbi:HigA family addiction module antitoxin [Sphingomonas sp. PB2P19]|uniref:HigA family addiction module antitoxin n=1 Tax=Sphingomonas rhamnosi TaxID=3096156 RepID=UPI002FC7296C